MGLVGDSKDFKNSQVEMQIVEQFIVIQLMKVRTLGVYTEKTMSFFQQEHGNTFEILLAATPNHWIVT